MLAYTSPLGTDSVPEGTNTHACERQSQDVERVMVRGHMPKLQELARIQVTDLAHLVQLEGKGGAKHGAKTPKEHRHCRNRQKFTRHCRKPPKFTSLQLNPADTDQVTKVNRRTPIAIPQLGHYSLH